MARSFYSWTRFNGQSPSQDDQQFDTTYLQFCRGIYEFQFNLGLGNLPFDPDGSASYFGTTYTPDDFDIPNGPEIPFSKALYPVIYEVLRRSTADWGDYPTFLNIENGNGAWWLDSDLADIADRRAACDHIKIVRDAVEEQTSLRPLFSYQHPLQASHAYSASDEELAEAYRRAGAYQYCCAPCTVDFDLDTSKVRVDAAIANFKRMKAVLDDGVQQVSRPLICRYPNRYEAEHPGLLIFLNPTKMGIGNNTLWQPLLDYIVEKGAEVDAGLMGWADGGNVTSWTSSGIQDRIAEFNIAAEQMSRY